MIPLEPDERFEDCHGIAFADYRLHLPTTTREFPRAGVVKDADLMRFYHAEGWRCGRCGPKPLEFRLEVHHIEGGTKGRSDERCNLMHLCPTCHDLVKTSKFRQGEVLFLKWRLYPEEIDWVRMAILRQAFLPDLIPVPLPWF